MVHICCQISLHVTNKVRIGCVLGSLYFIRIEPTVSKCLPKLMQVSAEQKKDIGKENVVQEGHFVRKFSQKKKNNTSLLRPVSMILSHTCCLKYYFD